MPKSSGPIPFLWQVRVERLLLDLGFSENHPGELWKTIHTLDESGWELVVERIEKVRLNGKTEIENPLGYILAVAKRIAHEVTHKGVPTLYDPARKHRDPLGAFNWQTWRRRFSIEQRGRYDWLRASIRRETGQGNWNQYCEMRLTRELSAIYRTERNKDKAGEQEASHDGA